MQETYLSNTSSVGQIVCEMLASFDLESSEHNWANVSGKAKFWQVGLSDVVLSEYPDKSHYFPNLIFMTSSFIKKFIQVVTSLGCPCPIPSAFELPWM